jgi:serine/threonine protein kinase
MAGRPDEPPITPDPEAAALDRGLAAAFGPGPGPPPAAAPEPPAEPGTETGPSGTGAATGGPRPPGAVATDQDRLTDALDAPRAVTATASAGPGGAPDLSGRADPRPLTEGPGTRIGPYKLLERIGEGGMGVVFMAEQERPVRRKVALKVIKPGMDTDAVIARFEAERQALALMDHPNIARVLDAGATDAGRPFFVMELVHGVPITLFCDERRLTPRERLELFAPVCQALQHAHQKGVIHRDVKPSNVLVTEVDGRPVPKVIDFGVAKAVGQPLTDRTLLTGLGAVVGTPEYMSPEQAGASPDVDTRTDVYALGVLLYELLTGTTPLTRQRLRRAAMAEVFRAIREEEPPRPSTRLSESKDSLASISALRRTDPAHLTRLVRRDLDWVVMKSLEKDRSRRYATANELSADVQRYLADEPVQARPPSVRYRLGKFVRKHRAGAVAASLVLAALTAGVVGTAFGLVRARRERDAKQSALVRLQGEEAKTREALGAEQRARREADAAVDQTRDALRSMTDVVVERQIARQVTLTDQDRVFLKKVLASYERFASLRGDSPRTRAVRAEGFFRVARIHEKLGERDAALSEYRQALRLLKRLAAEFPAAPEYRHDLARCHDLLGRLLGHLGKQAEAEAEFREALALETKLAAEFPAAPEYRLFLSYARSNLGVLRMAKGKPAEAEAEYREVVALRKQLADDFPAVPEYHHELARGHRALGELLKVQARRSDAEAEYSAALALQTPLAAEFPAVPAYRTDLASTHHSLGNLLAVRGRRPEAEAEFRRAIVLEAQLAAEFPAVPDYRDYLASSHRDLANQLTALGRRTEAVAEIRTAVALLKPLVAEFPAVPAYRFHLGGCHSNLGARLLQLGKRSEAEAEYRAALALLKPLADDSPTVQDYQVGLGGLFFNLAHLVRSGGRPADSLTWFDQGVRTLSAVLAKEPRHAAAREFLRDGHYGRALALMKMDRFADAVRDLDRALELDDGSRRAGFRLQRALCLARTDPAHGVAEVEDLVKAEAVPAVTLYDAACACALSSARVEDAGAKERVAARAVELLRRAHAAGFFKDKARAEHMKMDRDLDPIRGRDDFRRLLLDLAMPAQPFAP